MTRTEFDEVSQELSERFAQWVGDRDRADLAGHALEYKWAIGDPYVTHWVGDDVDELLFGYLPARVFLVDEEIDDVIDAIGRFLEFLDSEGHMRKGSHRAPDLVAHLESHREEFRQAMEDPETGGHAKRLLMAMQADGVDLEDEEAVNSWLEDFNAGPIERREAVLGPAAEAEDRLDEGPGVELPPRPPVDEELARAGAAEAPLLDKIVAFAHYMGGGRPLTSTGNLKLADAGELVDLLQTGDVMDHDRGGKPIGFRTATELPWLDMIVWLAKECRAVKVKRNKMSATKAWRPRGVDHPLVAAAEIAEIVVGAGPLTALYGDRIHLDGSRGLIDASAVSLLASLYEEERLFDELVSALTEAVLMLVENPSYHDYLQEAPNFLEDQVAGDMEDLVRALEWAGLLTWTGSQSEQSRGDRREGRGGGVLAITDFGSWFVQGPLAEEGLVSAPVVQPLTITLDDSPEEIVAALAGTMEAGPMALVAAWEQLDGYEGLPEQLWRVDLAEAAPLLEALGASLPDKRTAKAARKALLKHRSWRANRA